MDSGRQKGDGGSRRRAARTFPDLSFTPSPILLSYPSS